jgi:3-deoxy-D-manno-octulosonic-acid transferase
MLGRIGWRNRLRAWARTSLGEKPLWLFHAASVGELEAIRPVIDRIIKRGKERVAVTVFSPSTYRMKPDLPGLDLFCYLPFDSIGNQRLLLKTIKPELLAISKHDVWPNLLGAALGLGIPTALINANFHPQSLRIHPVFRFFHRWVFCQFTSIATLSKEHANRLTSLVGNCVPCKVLGDSRYDRVIERCNKQSPEVAAKSHLLAGRTVIVAGSTHPKEERLLAPAIGSLVSKYPNLFVIWVPHDPESEALASLEQQLQANNLPTRRWSEDWSADGLTGVVVDQVGFLAELYSLSHIAIVGGGFDKGVHSVIEPAVFGLPVLFGPRYHVSQEANLLLEKGGGMIFHDQNDLLQLLQSLLGDSEHLRMTGNLAKSVVDENAGASDRIMAFLDDLKFNHSSDPSSF